MLVRFLRRRQRRRQRDVELRRLQLRELRGQRAEGLTCSPSGQLLDRCTASCSSVSDCAAFGSNTTCIALTQCTPLCITDADCPDQGQCVALTSGNSACVTNPNGPPGLTAPEGSCWYVGGGFGDTIANGGYRCTPVANGGVMSTIDQCNDGTWTTATFTCTCAVTGDTSVWTDFTSAGSAQCEYAFQVCAQCEPGGGCQ